MNIESEIEKIISAVSNLPDGESYLYPIPEEWRDYLSKVHIERPFGMAIWDGTGRVLISREVFSPKRMRKVLRSVMKRANGHDSSLAHPNHARERRMWAKLWGV